jgi:hypothetical protein
VLEVSFLYLDRVFICEFYTLKDCGTTRPTTTRTTTTATTTTPRPAPVLNRKYIVSRQINKKKANFKIIFKDAIQMVSYQDQAYMIGNVIAK